MGASRNAAMNPVIRCARLCIVLALTSCMLIMAAKPIEAAGISTAIDERLDLSDGISAQEAVVLAIRENFGLLALSKAREAALGGVTRAKAFAEPEIRIGASGLDDSRTTSPEQDYNIALRWTPPRLGERGLKGDLAMGKVAETDGAIAVVQHKLAGDILFLHTQIVFLDERIALAEAAVKVRDTILEFVDSQIKSELKTLLDRNIADLALADARLIPETYRAQRLVCINRLASELNLSIADLRIQKESDAFDLKPRLLDLPSLVDAAIANRPELSIIASARIAEAETTLNLNKRERYPWFSFFQTGPQFDVRSSSSRSWAFRLGVELPIFKWNNDFLREPVAEVQRSQMDLTALRRQIRMEVEQTATQLQARYRVLEHFDKAIAPILARDLTLIEESMHLGQTDQLQYLLAQAQGLQRRQAYLTDLLEYRRLEIELDRVTGSILPKKSKGNLK
jgi:outer membrane protein, heavy metal efflux system